MQVCCLILFQENKILACRRALHKSNGGLWEFPGGKLKQGESEESCIVREIQEELNITLKSVTRIQSFQSENIHLIPFISSSYLGKINALEHAEIAFFKAEDLPLLNWSPADIPLMSYILTHLNSLKSTL